MTATHIIGHTDRPYLDIQDDELAFTVTAKHPHYLTQIEVALSDAQRIGLAFAAIGGGSLDHTDQAARITDLITTTDEDLTDNDLIIVARRALRALAKRRKKRADEDRHVKDLLAAVDRSASDLTMSNAYARQLVRAGIRATDIK